MIYVMIQISLLNPQNLPVKSMSRPKKPSCRAILPTQFEFCVAAFSSFKKILFTFLFPSNSLMDLVKLMIRNLQQIKGFLLFSTCSSVKKSISVLPGRYSMFLRLSKYSTIRLYAPGNILFGEVQLPMIEHIISVQKNRIRK